MVKRTQSRGAAWKNALTSPLTQLVTVVVCAIAGAFVVVGIALQGKTPEEKTVAVYRTHGCTCALSWAADLRASGFEVRVLELSSLNRVRATLHVPPRLNGCHVARYLDYFVEGHVPALAIARLAADRPSAWGVVTATSMESGPSHDVDLKVEERSEVVLVATDGTARPWTSFFAEGVEATQ